MNKEIDKKISFIVKEFLEIKPIESYKFKACEALKIIKDLKDNSRISIHKNECAKLNKKINYQVGLITPKNYNCIKSIQCPNCESYFFEQDTVIDLIDKAENELGLLKNE